MKRGKKFIIYGAFKSKKKARTVEKKHSGAFILRRTIKGRRRHIVLRRKGN